MGRRVIGLEGSGVMGEVGRTYGLEVTEEYVVIQSLCIYLFVVWAADL